MKPFLRAFLPFLLGWVVFWVFAADFSPALGESDGEKPAAAKKGKGDKKRINRKKAEAGTDAADESDAMVAEEQAAELEMTAAERAALNAERRKGTVPNFAAEEDDSYNVDTENEFYNQSIRNRRDDEAFPSTSLVLRRYADSVVEKYDFNKDGLLQESEWSKISGAPQAMDMNGDFLLEADEILYYLARYARDRTIFRPVPPVPPERRHLLKLTDRSILIRPLSGKMKTETAEEAEKAKENEGLADLTEEDLNAMIEETDEAVGTEGDPELFGLLIEEMDESKQREYAAPLESVRGMPVWFLARDINGDGQLSLREFAPGLSLEATAFFGRLDADSDGCITPDEVRKYMNSGETVSDSAE